MSSTSQNLQCLSPDLARSRLSTAFKNAVMKNYPNKDKPCDAEASGSNILEKMTVSDNEELTEDISKLSTYHSDSESSPEHAQKRKLLSSMLEESTSEEDLLCKISMAKTESNVQDENDEKLLNLEHTIYFEDVDQRSMINKKFNLSLLEQQKVPALQIGKCIPLPILSVDEAKFSEPVSKVLKVIKFYGPSCIQSVVWPAVERGRHIFVVAPPHSGKTVSYVVPLASRYTSGEISLEVTTGEDKGPHTIVLCSSWRKAHAIKEYFNLFFGVVKRNIFMLYTNGGHFKNRIQSRINNCDILIATPYCLLEFLQDKLINCERLFEFIVDDGSSIMIKHKQEFKEIMLGVMDAMRKCQCSPQIIVCTERWNKNFQIIADKVMRDTVLYFTSFLEAAIYAKIPINAHVCESKNKKKGALYDIIKNLSRKVVICTTDKQDAVEIHLFLRRVRCSSYLLTEELDHYLADDVIKDWKVAKNGSSCHCLIVTDCLVGDMRLSCADCLIHFDIPSKSRLQFGNRFSVIAKHFENKESSSKCACHVLILESEHNHAANLVEIIENSGGVPNEKLIELSKRHVKEDNISADLCYYLKAFGTCATTNCEKRHKIIPDVDKPQIVPYEGDIQGIVTHIIDASHYYIRLVKYLDPISNKTTSLVGTYAKLGFQLRDFYLQASTDMKVETPVVGDVYVLEEENKLFFRVKILEFNPESANYEAWWKVLYIDEGWMKHHKVLKLYKMTSEIDLPKPLAVEVFTCNIAPADSFLDWNPHTSKFVSDLLKGKQIHGKIVLCIGSTLWLDPLAVTVRLSDGHYVYPFKIDQKLLDFGHIIKRPSHIESLLKLCVDKIPLPHFTKTKMKEEDDFKPEPTISYAFLDCNVYEDVYVSSVISPDHLYVQRAKFVDCLDDLLDKINSQIEKKKLKIAYSFFKDMICIAPFFEDNRYYRAIITDLLPDDKVRVFYVDFGDSGTVLKKEIFSISAEFLLLPFQAIECELAGIKAAHGGWTESAISALTLMTRDDAGDMKIVQMMAYSKISSYSCGNRYLIDLWDCDKKLSEKLLEAGFGVPDDSSTVVTNDSSASAACNSTSELNGNKSSSDEMHPEDQEAALNFFSKIAEMMAKQYNIDPNTLQTSEHEDSDDDEETILKKCNFTKPSTSNTKQSNLQEVLPNSQPKKIPASEPPPNSIRPPITWWDTPEELNILINLREIKLYELDIKDESLSFNTIVAGIQYSTLEVFYKKINSADAKTESVVQGIKIVAKKTTPFKWPRLTKEKKKFFHIKYDLVHIEDSDSEENSQLKEKLKKEQAIRRMYEEDGSSSTDEEETFVEPWKEFAQQKDPIKNVLSEI